MENDNVKVFIKAENGVITAINSSAFLTDVDGWIQIDEGNGDKFMHAQNNYFELPLMGDDGIFNYKFVDGQVMQRTDEDKAPELQKIINAGRILELKQMLADTDYIAAKIAEGAATVEEYAGKIAQRQGWRDEINELEGQK